MIKNLISPNFIFRGAFIIFTLFIQFVPLKSVAQINSFKFEVYNNTGKIEQDIICDIYGDSLIIGVIPYQAKDLKLIPTFSMGSNNKAYINAINQESKITENDYKSALFYDVKISGKVKYRYKVELIYTGLPLVYVNTDNIAPINSKDIYVNGQIIIYPNNESPKFSATMQIKGRGNSTWTMPKKPYKVKLANKASILGMPEDKEWVLLANYADKSLIRTSIALGLGQKARFAYTPNMQHVDLILNGIYQGTYLIGEQIKVSKGRVNIKELDDADNDEQSISGGYLLEIDARLDETYWFRTSKDLPVTIKSPEDITPQQLEYISNYFKTTEDALYSSDFHTENGYIKYINPETFIDFYWINELFKNNDAQFYSSVYLYKDRNSKLNVGPLWDFDISAGNINYNGCDYPIGWWIRDSKWIDRLFEDPAF
ncbi:MAG: CotH kinase family protein [Sporocytophaga sp.]|nr:CotH kinase family protein [Sporocytophaga sp.]